MCAYDSNWDAVEQKGCLAFDFETLLGSSSTLCVIAAPWPSSTPQKAIELSASAAGFDGEHEQAVRFERQLLLISSRVGCWAVARTTHAAVVSTCGTGLKNLCDCALAHKTLKSVHVCAPLNLQHLATRTLRKFLCTQNYARERVCGMMKADSVHRNFALRLFVAIFYDCHFWPSISNFSAETRPTKTARKQAAGAPRTGNDRTLCESFCRP